MRRKDFFKKSILGAFAIWKTPEILAEVAKTPDITYSTKGILDYITTNSIDYSSKFTYLDYLTGMHRVFDIDLTEEILAEMDLGPHWTKEQEQILLNTRR